MERTWHLEEYLHILPFKHMVSDMYIECFVLNLLLKKLTYHILVHPNVTLQDYKGLIRGRLM